MTRLPVSLPKLTPKTFLTGAKLVGKYSGATQMANDAWAGVKHPIRRIKGEDAPIVMVNGRPVRMMVGEIPNAPGKALAGALARVEQRGVPKEMLQSLQDARHVVSTSGNVQFRNADGTELAPGALREALKRIGKRKEHAPVRDKVHTVAHSDDVEAESFDPFSYRFPGLVEKKGRASMATTPQLHHDDLRSSSEMLGGSPVNLWARGDLKGGKEHYDMELHMFDTDPDGLTPARIMAGAYNGTSRSTQGAAGTTMATPARMRGLTRTLHELKKEGIHLDTPRYESPPMLAKVAKSARTEGAKTAIANRQARVVAAQNPQSAQERAVQRVMGAVRDNPRMPPESAGGWARRMSAQAKLPPSPFAGAGSMTNSALDRHYGDLIGGGHHGPRPRMGSSTQRQVDRIMADLGLGSKKGASGYRGRS